MTPTPKEGPPTLRECREELKRVRQFIRNGIDYGYIHMPEEGDPAIDILKKLNRVIFPLTDEALELDEKRRAALEELVVAVRLLYKEFPEGLAQRGHANSAKYKLADAMAKIDALTPTPKEES